MMDVVAIAPILYRLICRDAAETQEDVSNCIYSIFEHTCSDYPPKRLIDGQIIAHRLVQSQSINRTIDRWRAHFNLGNAVQEPKAHDFIRDVLNSTEDTGAWFTKTNNDILAGSNTRTTNTCTDIKTYPRRTRLHWGIHFTIEGNGLYDTGLTSTVSSIGDIVLFSPCVNMSIRRDSSCSKWKYLYIHFPLISDYLHLLQWPEVAPGIAKLALPADGAQKISVLFQEAIETGVSKLPLSNELLQSILKEILIRCRQASLKDGIGLIDRRVARATSIIHNFAEKPISIDDIAKNVGLSRSRLNHLFKQQIGVSPLQWRESQRMLRACQMLTGSHKSISQIAEAIGYSDTHYFSRCFRQHMGCTPSSYRKTNPCSEISGISPLHN